MEIEIRSGCYVVAVSGGVDSMVLMHLLSALPNMELIVAHFDHGMRIDSAEDRRLVEVAARQLKLKFIYAQGNLGKHASEAAARTARYNFLQQTARQEKATAILTAHNQDDLLETAILNILRGTGRRGLTSLSSHDNLVRPLLKYSKAEIISYAQTHNIHWREDPTNQDDNYLRNYIRHHLLPRFGLMGRTRLLKILDQMRVINLAIDILIDEYLQTEPTKNALDRYKFTQLPYKVAGEIMASWLRRNDIDDFDKKTIHRLVVAACTAQPGKVFDIKAGQRLIIKQRQLWLEASGKV